MKLNRAFFFNITYSCNNNCLGCVSKHTKLKSNRVIQLSNVMKIHQQHCFDFNDRFVISGGEPFINSEFAQIILMLANYSKHIVVYTNGRRLDSVSFKILNNIERVIVPFYGTAVSHDEYTQVKGSFLETYNAIMNVKDAIMPILDLKLIIKGESEAKQFLDNEKIALLLSRVSTVSLCGFINPQTGYSDLGVWKAIPLIETLAEKVLDLGCRIKIYDIPLCGFSYKFRKKIIECFMPSNSIQIEQIVCCSTEGNFRNVKYDKNTYYNKLCNNCAVNKLCSQVLKRYFVLGYDGSTSYLDTE